MTSVSTVQTKKFPCSFADGIFDMHQDPCVCLFMVAFLHSLQRSAWKYIFPLSDVDTLVFGTPDAIYLLRQKIKHFCFAWRVFNEVLPVTWQLSIIGNLLSLSVPSFSSNGFLHTICSITVPYNIHSVTALQLAYEKRNKHFLSIFWKFGRCARRNLMGYALPLKATPWKT